MPPFSPDDNPQAKHYHNGGSVNVSSGMGLPLIPDERAHLQVEGMHETTFAVGGFGASLVGKWSWNAPPPPQYMKGGGQPTRLNLESSELDSWEEDDSYFDDDSDGDGDDGVGFYHDGRYSFGAITTIPLQEQDYCSNWLFPIPEKKVSFAERILHNQTVVDDLEVRWIPHVSEFTPDEKSRGWYTRAQLKAFRNSCARAALAAARNRELFCPCYLRGLEYLVEEGLEHYLEEEGSASENGDADADARQVYKKIREVLQRPGHADEGEEEEEDSDSTAESRRWDGLEAVLLEQERQRIMGTFNPERIRSVYRTRGKVATSQSIARFYAERDEAFAKEWLNKDTESKEEQPQQADASYFYCENDDVDEETTNELPKSLRWAVSKALTPFLDIREGNVFLPMGEECFLEYS